MDKGIACSWVTEPDVCKRSLSESTVHSNPYQNHCLWDGNCQVGPKSIWKYEIHKIGKRINLEKKSWRIHTS